MKAKTWSSELCSCQSLIANGSELERLSGATVRIKDCPGVSSTNQASMVGTSANSIKRQIGRSNSASTIMITTASTRVAFLPLLAGAACGRGACSAAGAPFLAWTVLAGTARAAGCRAI